MHHTLNLLADGDGWTKVIVPTIIVVFWVVNGIAGALKKKPTGARPQPPVQQPSALEAFQREVAERLRQGQTMSPPQSSPELQRELQQKLQRMQSTGVKVPLIVNPKIAAMQRRQAVQRQQLAARQAAPNQRAVNPPAMAHPELAAMQNRQAALRQQNAARQTQPPKRKVAPPPIPTAIKSAPRPAAAAAPVAPPPEALSRVTKPALPPVNAAVIAAWMTPETLRKQFIITEIFQPPMSMRENG